MENITVKVLSLIRMEIDMLGDGKTINATGVLTHGLMETNMLGHSKIANTI